MPIADNQVGPGDERQPGFGRKLDIARGCGASRTGACARECANGCSTGGAPANESGIALSLPFSLLPAELVATRNEMLGQAARPALKMKRELVGTGRSRFEVQIVDQACFADEHREEHVAGLADTRDRLEVLGVHDLHIVDHREPFGSEFAPHTRLQVKRVALPRLELFFRKFQGSVQNGRGLALLWVQVKVARR